MLVISNHKCDLDYFFAWATAARVGVLQPGHFNAVAKGVLRKVPLFGWLFKLVGFLFLARSWEADRDRIMAWCTAAAARKRPQWLVLYPEGTRFTAKAKAKSDAAAKEHSMQPLDGELLLPRPKGFVELSKALPAAGFTHILDMTLVYISSDGTTPLAGQQLGTSALVRLGAGALPMSRVDVHCALFPLSDVAQAPSDDARRDWLLQRWKHKERLLQRAVATGTLTEGPHTPGDDAPVPLGRTAWMAALATAAMVAFVRLMAHSGLFRWCVCPPAMSAKLSLAHRVSPLTSAAPRCLSTCPPAGMCCASASGRRRWRMWTRRVGDTWNSIPPMWRVSRCPGREGRLPLGRLPQRARTEAGLSRIETAGQKSTGQLWGGDTDYSI